ncbi:hypothetical protein CHS0354_040153 [Potamilus streckersoni]|uniref:Small ribosomal subunit protein uS10m n=1 Tax=Potamilus streckersoni TaxID=2493646 RepID=A0AAE0SSX3_9BIVA|nr:hypothetical protein CHS0354_040153 [Potamilus streckersoni]
MAAFCSVSRLLSSNIVRFQLLRILERRLGSLTNPSHNIQWGGVSCTCTSLQCYRSIQFSPFSSAFSSSLRSYSDIPSDEKWSTDKKVKEKVEDDDAVAVGENHVHDTTDSDEMDVLYRQITLEVKGHEPAVINSYTKYVSMAANELGITISSIKTPPKNIKRMVLLKSAHIYKKHQVHYEMRTHFRVIELKHLTGSTADTFLEYIQRNLPEGMAMKVTRHRLEQIPEHLKPPPSQSATAGSS